MSRGDVVWVEFPAGEGRAQSGRRPAVILQDAAHHLPTTLVVPLSTQLAALRFPGTVLIEPDAGNGLRLSSVALVFQLREQCDHFIHFGKLDHALSPSRVNKACTDGAQETTKCGASH